MSEIIEYSLFNELEPPDTIDQISPSMRWIYENQFSGIYYSKELAEQRAEEENQWRIDSNNSMFGTTKVIVKHRRVIKGDWQK